MIILQFIKLSHVNVIRQEFETDGLREEAPPKSLSFCHHAPVAFARWQ